MIYHTAPQGSPEWLEARRGLVTGSKFKNARDKLKSGKPSGKCTLYAQDVARERCGGKAASVFVNGAMKFGTEQEPLARQAYETTTGNFVVEVGFASSECGMYGLSPDGLVGDDGVIEIKTMVGSDNLFTAAVEEDLSEYIDQCLGYLLFLDRQWVDLVLWAPDLEEMGLGLSIIRIPRDEEAIAALKSDLAEFSVLVRQFESALRKKAAANVDRLLLAA
jgi:YqaJ-like viral recombinase domain